MSHSTPSADEPTSIGTVVSPDESTGHGATTGAAKHAGSANGGWATSLGDIVVGAAPDAVLAKVVSGRLLLDDGSEVEAGSVLIEFMNALLADGLRDRRARLEIVADLVTAEAAARLLGVSRPTVYAWQDSGTLGQIMQGNRRMVPLEDIHRVRAARHARVGSDTLAHDAAEAGPVLTPADYEQELSDARRRGGAGAVAVVRRRQRAARVAEAAALAYQALGGDVPGDAGP